MMNVFNGLISRLGTAIERINKLEYNFYNTFTVFVVLE